MFAADDYFINICFKKYIFMHIVASDKVKIEVFIFEFQCFDVIDGKLIDENNDRIRRFSMCGNPGNHFFRITIPAAYHGMLRTL